MHEIFLIVIQGVGEKGEGRTDFCHKGGGAFSFFVDQTNKRARIYRKAQ